MRFQLKIFIVTITILVITLLLNSLLSLATFEKIYVSSLISTNELSGKNLKRKIEQSLRFGKPLDKFQGMEALLEEVIQKNPSLSDVGVGAVNGQILYHTNPKMVGNTFPAPAPTFDEAQLNTPTHLLKGEYITYLPLSDRSDMIVGVLRITFSRDVIYRKLKTVASENFKILWLLMLAAGVSLLIFLILFVAQPLKLQLHEIANMLKWPGDPSYNFEKMLEKPDQSPVLHERAFAANGVSPSFNSEIRYLDLKALKNEVDQLGFNLRQFIADALKTLDAIEGLMQQQSAIFHYSEKLSAAEVTLRNAAAADSELSSEAHFQVELLLTETRHLVDKIRMLQHILLSQNRIRRIGQ